MRARPARWSRATVLLALLVLSLPPLTGVGLPAARGQSATRPNIVLILADDLDLRSLTDHWSKFPHLAALRRNGTFFSSFIATTPLCCPSRATILTGRYAHNHGVMANKGEDGPQGFNPRDTIAVRLNAAGYRTALFGKYFNGYPRKAPAPRGWDEWDAFTGYEQRGRYATDVLAKMAESFIERHADRSFFLYLAPSAPHSPATPPLRHRDAFTNVRAPRTIAFDEKDVSDKPKDVARLRRLEQDDVARIDEHYRDRLRTMLAVDDMVGRVNAALGAAGVRDDTYVVFASDNGYMQGEHRIRKGKLFPYEEAIRVPLVVRGPGVAAGRVEDRMVLTTDLAPTIADWARTSPPSRVDGRSLFWVLKGNPPEEWRSAALIETRRWRGVRTRTAVFIDYANGEREFYDLTDDPRQVHNRGEKMPDETADRWQKLLRDLKNCAGDRCRAAERRG